MRETSRGYTISKIEADLHIHSYISDGEIGPEEIVRYAKRIGLAAISITDHNTFLGSYIASKRSDKVVIVPGAEFRTELGDILVLCERIPVTAIREIKLKGKGLKYVELSSIIDLATKENCVTVAAHPFALVRKGVGRLFELKYLDCVEVFNSSSDVITNVYTILAARNKRCKVAGSDAHVPELIGSAYTLVNTGNANVEEIIESIKKAKTEPYYRVNFGAFKSLTSVKSRLVHTFRTRLGIYGNPWERVSLYPI